MGKYIMSVYDVSNPCNYRCAYCRNDWSDESNTKHSQLADVKEIIDCIVKSGFKSISFTGGEFFLIPFWKDILVYAIEKGLTNQVITNASLIKEEDIEFLQKYVKRVNVSFHSADNKQYNEIMGITDSKVLKKVISNLKLMGNRGIELGIFFSPLRTNYKSFFKTIKKLKDNDIQITDVNLNRILPVGNAEVFLNEEKPLGYFEHAILIQQLLKINNELGINAYAEAYPLCFLNKLIDGEEIIKNINRPCIMGRQALALDNKGRIKLCPCTGLSINASINCIEKGIDRDIEFAKYSEGQWRNDFCKECKYWANCLGGCHSSRGELFSDDSLIIDDEIELKNGIDNEFFDLLIELYRPFLGTSFKKVPTAYTVFSKNKYKHPIGIIAIKKTKTGANFLEIALIPDVRETYYSFLVFRKLISLHPKLEKLGWTAYKENLPSMKILKKLEGGFFEKTVTNKGRKEAEGFFKVNGEATRTMQEALDKQIKLTKPKFGKWLEEYKARDKESEKLKNYLDGYYEDN